MEVFPQAKVVLSVRDAEGWYKSFRDTIYQFYVKDLAMMIMNKLIFSNWDEFERVLAQKPDNVDQSKC